MDEDKTLTVRVLESIRDEIKGLRQDTNTRFQSVENRLDHLAEGQVRMATEMAENKQETRLLRQETHGLRHETHQLRERVERFLHTEGDIIRDLKARMSRVEAHVGLDELP